MSTADYLHIVLSFVAGAASQTPMLSLLWAYWSGWNAEGWQ